jgi:hypothetical protein
MAGTENPKGYDPSLMKQENKACAGLYIIEVEVPRDCCGTTGFALRRDGR